MASVEDVQHVLVVDDDPTVSDVVRRYLEHDGFRVTLAGDGMDALDRYRADHPDLVVLDLMLPRLPGIEVCRTLRMESDVPIVMLTALGDETDRVAGLTVGADDYLAKPFSPRELVLRVRAVLRRASAGNDNGETQPLVDGDLHLDPAARVVTKAGAELALTVREFDLLEFLLRHPGQAFSRSQLLENVWDWRFGDQSTVTVHVRRLREKVEDDPAAPCRIVTVWGVGYRFEARHG
ncbi:MAG TPA: response regulator transcription factor [Stackebrandtia sp.]|jgi:DNA-binding response OmpR family regulator|uniref:response regulator transcription factor n=1 Tax=Stackebrandtia sp. TaxID=2023065 RepID=UPI002D577F1C|nr:response regulator transcription factor [Stackebrandtia sp.]HZE40759.1 response regulator transcription factor [Stackebrandtia sp.]